jgi:hypothetical protein
MGNFVDASDAYVTFWRYVSHFFLAFRGRLRLTVHYLRICLRRAWRPMWASLPTVLYDAGSGQ